MKPACPFDPLPKLARGEVRETARQFPSTVYFFRGGMGEWRRYWSPYDGDNGQGIRNFRRLSREYLAEFSRERAKELTVFVLVALTSAWPVIYMVITVVKLLNKGRPLDQ
jgi:hypothetical protein